MKTFRSILLAAGLLFPLHLLHAQTETQTNTLVSAVAAEEGLELLSPEEVPPYGTFWLVISSPFGRGNMAPIPCPPFGFGNDNIYEIADGQFLVDQTTNDVSEMSTDVITAQASPILALIDRVQATATRQALRAMGMDSGGGPFPGGGGTNDYGDDGDYTNTYNYTPPDYGTNLWIAQWNLTSGNVTGIASNTLADVLYEVLTNSDLTTTNWVSTGWFFPGSEATNWTWLPVMPASVTNNLFYRLRSWVSSDGNGLPDWWESEYGVTDPYGDPTGDGWSNLQKFQNGWDPNVFYTPAAPQGLTATLNQSNNTATISWLPSPGAVTDYTLEKTDSYIWYSPTVQDFNMSATSTSYADDLSSDTPDSVNGFEYDVSYRIMASYTNGNNSAWSVSIPLQQPTVSALIIAGTNGTTYLAVSGVPTSAVTVQLVFIDQNAVDNGDTSFDYTEDIPVSSLTNGLYQVPETWLPPVTDTYGDADYYVYAESMDASGNASRASVFYTTEGNWPAPYRWGVPFYDGRVQLKQNLIFKLRAAGTDRPFKFYYLDSSNAYDYVEEFYDPPTNHVESSLLHVTDTLYDTNDGNPYDYYNSYGTLIDPQFPFFENYLFNNFIFNSANTTSYGQLNTGVGSGYAIDSGLNLSATPQWKFQAPSGDWTTIAGLLDASDTGWICSLPLHNQDEMIYTSGQFDENDVTHSNSIFTLASGAVNLYGLPFSTEKIAGQGHLSDGIDTTISLNLAPGDASPPYSFSAGPVLYAGTAQPQLATVEYDFWSPVPVWNAALGRFIENWLPGSQYFSPTNQSQQFFVPVGRSVSIAGYAKMALQNGYTGVYGYLGQYFDTAYKIDDSGNVTTNQTGVLSPYGSFFATEPGPVALVTMPDIDTGERGTCTVYCVSLQLDKNHDGTMDTSFSGADATSQNSPFVFWRNNNFDRVFYDNVDAVNYEDDLDSIDIAKLPANEQVSDCNYTDSVSGGRAIPTARDLEDFARLWVCGVNSNLVAVLPTNSTVTLSWGDVGTPNPTNPTIDLFIAADANGKMGYLTNSTIADTQVGMANGAYGGAYVGRIGPGQSVQLNVARFLQPGNWLGNYYIWCGVSNGTGGLILTIADGDGNVLAQTTAYIQIRDIKQMYERWTVGDIASQAPLTVAIKASNDLPTNPAVPPFEYALPRDTNTPYILFVHGWNMRTDDKDHFAETAFKRLYWQGYQGRFGVFRWPTENGFNGISSLATDLSEKDNYDRSEYQAWQSGQGLLNKLTELNSEYPGHVYLLAHSMGNIVAGEALRLAGSSQVINIYVASQAAVSAHTYDTNIADYSFSYASLSSQAQTPNIYGNWFVGNYGGGAGTVVNFYNTNDYALQRSIWQIDQLLKPDQFILLGGTHWDYSYVGLTNDPPPWNHFEKAASLELWNIVEFDIVNVLTNRYEVMGLAAQSWTTALGATPGVQHVADSIYLGTVWPPDSVHPTHPFDEHFYHSAEFRGDFWQQQGYWEELLGSDAFNLKQP